MENEKISFDPENILNSPPKKVICLKIVDKDEINFEGVKKRNHLKERTLNNFETNLKEQNIEETKELEEKNQELEIEKSEKVAEVRTNNEQTCEVKSLRRSNRIKINQKMPQKKRQTPMGLPKAERLDKKRNFTLEEIYTNKNYSTPKTKPLRTIYEVPKELPDGQIRFEDRRTRYRGIQFSTHPRLRVAKRRDKNKTRGIREMQQNRKRNRLDDQVLMETLRRVYDDVIDDNQDDVSSTSASK